MRFSYRLWLPTLAAAAFLAVTTTVVRAATSGSLIMSTEGHADQGLAQDNYIFTPTFPDENFPNWDIYTVLNSNGNPAFSFAAEILNFHQSIYSSFIVEPNANGQALDFTVFDPLQNDFSNTVRTGQLFPDPDFDPPSGGVWHANSSRVVFFKDNNLEPSVQLCGDPFTTDEVYCFLTMPTETLSHISSSSIEVQVDVTEKCTGNPAQSTGNLYVIAQDDFGHTLFSEQVASNANANTGFTVNAFIPLSAVMNKNIVLGFWGTTSGNIPITFVLGEPEFDYTVNYNPGFFF